MVNGYYPVIEALARGLDIRLNQRFVFLRILNCWSVLLPNMFPRVITVGE